MRKDEIKELLEEVREGRVDVAEASRRLAAPTGLDLGHTCLDTEREERCGLPEVVYGAGKTPDQLVDIARAILERHDRLLVTRVTDEGAQRLLAELPRAVLHAASRAVTVEPEGGLGEEGRVVIVSAGTSDEGVAEEAAVTARMLGARVVRLRDVGVAGLHRLLSRSDELRKARVLVVVAGMEGALPSVVGGLVQRPVIAVPTSVGYGAAFGGLTALLAMLNSCAAGVSVVNIDNGFGAGYQAALINKEHEKQRAMSTDRKAWLALESGVVLEGRAVGADGEAQGDLVFNTAMTGYQEILTDPSYAGQIVMMTYPLIGNYGVALEDNESGRAWAEAFVMKEMSRVASNHRSNVPLGEWLRSENVVAIDGVDTRMLTRLTRTQGSLRCIVSTTDSDRASLVAKARAAQSTDGRDLASGVTCREAYPWSAGFEESYPTELAPSKAERIRLVAYDFGAKRNILRSLVHCGFDVEVVPCGTPAAEVLAREPQAVFLSNGPGDPAAVKPAIAAVRGLVGQLPIFGICLGHQILSIVLGARTEKMPFGHHGANHPVRDLLTEKVEITSQNHSFAVAPGSLPKELELTHVNLNDGTVEGMRHRELPIFSVQYHPEAAPGPLDSAHLFQRFRELIVERGCKVQ